ncbi:hypothetical protein M426DRAFT_251349 [Hypoxylon sp. CI-4A]|nr:hypothetical protein M426DRAFT_251349 [Hypoxylon sp. CI-4A]
MASGIVVIVAIHGIAADPDTTWTEKSTNCNWLQDPQMLPEHVPSARIMRFGYKSKWYGAGKDKPKITRVFDVAEMLLSELEGFRANDISRPIIFIAHSYGGLVLLQALRRSFDNPTKWGNPFQSTAGLVFFGTPFRGRKRSPTIEEMANALMEHNPDLQIFSETMTLSMEENPYLDEIVHRYTDTRSLGHNIPLRCFYETMPSPIGKVLMNNEIKDYQNSQLV